MKKLCSSSSTLSWPTQVSQMLLRSTKQVSIKQTGAFLMPWFCHMQICVVAGGFPIIAETPGLMSCRHRYTCSCFLFGGCSSSALLCTVKSYVAEISYFSSRSSALIKSDWTYRSRTGHQPIQFLTSTFSPDTTWSFADSLLTVFSRKLA